jgi:hypothetical protein
VFSGVYRAAARFTTLTRKKEREKEKKGIDKGEFFSLYMVNGFPTSGLCFLGFLVF